MSTNKIKTLGEAVVKYGPIISGKWPKEGEWMVLHPTPDWFQDRVHGLDGKPCKRIYMNKDLVAPFDEALKNIKDRGHDDELVSFDGCFNIRLVRGSTDAQSAHSYGLAVDLNAPQNPLGGPVRFTDGFIQCFRDAGFTCGADFKSRKDGQHFSYCWE